MNMSVLPLWWFLMSTKKIFRSLLCTLKAMETSIFLNQIPGLHHQWATSHHRPSLVALGPSLAPMKTMTPIWMRGRGGAHQGREWKKHVSYIGKERMVLVKSPTILKALFVWKNCLDLYVSLYFLVASLFQEHSFWHWFLLHKWDFNLLKMEVGLEMFPDSGGQR